MKEMDKTKGCFLKDYQKWQNFIYSNEEKKERGFKLLESEKKEEALLPTRKEK
jgi:hypothetical protein